MNLRASRQGVPLSGVGGPGRGGLSAQFPGLAASPDSGSFGLQMSTFSYELASSSSSSAREGVRVRLVGGPAWRARLFLPPSLPPSCLPSAGDLSCQAPSPLGPPQGLRTFSWTRFLADAGLAPAPSWSSEVTPNALGRGDVGTGLQSGNSWKEGGPLLSGNEGQGEPLGAEERREAGLGWS